MEQLNKSSDRTLVQGKSSKTNTENPSVSEKADDEHSHEEEPEKKPSLLDIPASKAENASIKSTNETEPNPLKEISRINPCSKYTGSYQNSRPYYSTRQTRGNYYQRFPNSGLDLRKYLELDEDKHSGISQNKDSCEFRSTYESKNPYSKCIRCGNPCTLSSNKLCPSCTSEKLCAVGIVPKASFKYEKDKVVKSNFIYPKDVRALRRGCEIERFPNTFQSKPYCDTKQDQIRTCVSQIKNLLASLENSDMNVENCTPKPNHRCDSSKENSKNYSAESNELDSIVSKICKLSTSETNSQNHHQQVLAYIHDILDKQAKCAICNSKVKDSENYKGEKTRMVDNKVSSDTKIKKENHVEIPELTNSKKETPSSKLELTTSVSAIEKCIQLLNAEKEKACRQKDEKSSVNQNSRSQGPKNGQVNNVNNSLKGKSSTSSLSISCGTSDSDPKPLVPTDPCSSNCCKESALTSCPKPSEHYKGEKSRSPLPLERFSRFSPSQKSRVYQRSNYCDNDRVRSPYLPRSPRITENKIYQPKTTCGSSFRNDSDRIKQIEKNCLERGAPYTHEDCSNFVRKQVRNTKIYSSSDSDRQDRHFYENRQEDENQPTGKIFQNHVGTSIVQEKTGNSKYRVILRRIKSRTRSKSRESVLDRSSDKDDSYNKMKTTRSKAVQIEFESNRFENEDGLGETDITPSESKLKQLEDLIGYEIFKVIKQTKELSKNIATLRKQKEITAPTKVNKEIQTKN